MTYPRGMAGRGESAAVIALLRGASGSWREVVEQLDEVGSARALLDSTPGRLFETAQPADLEAIADEIGAWEREGMRFVTVLDADYPENLRGVYDRPPFIFVRGRLLDRDAEGVTVVGTRQATPAGLELARAVVRRARRRRLHGVTAASASASAWTGRRTSPRSSTEDEPSRSSGRACGAPTRPRTLLYRSASRGSARWSPSSGPMHRRRSAHSPCVTR